MGEIREGLEHGLTTEQVSIYADEHFSGPKMWEIREALESGIGIDKIKMLINHKFTEAQML